MHPRALAGLVRAQASFDLDWPEESGAGNALLRIFDVSARVGTYLPFDWTTVGRNLPFPQFAILGDGDIPVLVSTNAEKRELYAYCHTPDGRPTLVVLRMVGAGCGVDAMRRSAIGGEKEYLIEKTAYHVAERIAALLGVIENACDDTRTIVSYTLNRAERRCVSREVGDDRLRGSVVHRICLDGRAREALVAWRGPTVIPTPKRLHEVRSHWRHLRSGKVTRVRSHRRGIGHGSPSPRVYALPSATRGGGDGDDG